MTTIQLPKILKLTRAGRLSFATGYKKIESVLTRNDRYKKTYF